MSNCCLHLHLSLQSLQACQSPFQVGLLCLQLQLLLLIHITHLNRYLQHGDHHPHSSQHGCQRQEPIPYPLPSVTTVDGGGVMQRIQSELLSLRLQEGHAHLVHITNIKRLAILLHAIITRHLTSCNPT